MAGSVSPRLVAIIVSLGVLGVGAAGAASASSQAVEPDDVSTAADTPGTWTPAPAPLKDGPPSNKEPDAGLGSEPDDSGVGTLSNHGCESGFGCFWFGDNYTGTKLKVEGTAETCCAWRYVYGYEIWQHSVKNNYNNRNLRIGNENIVIDCLNPGANRPNPQRFDRARIGGAGSTC